MVNVKNLFLHLYCCTLLIKQYLVMVLFLRIVPVRDNFSKCCVIISLRKGRQNPKLAWPCAGAPVDGDRASTSCRAYIRGVYAPESSQYHM